MGNPVDTRVSKNRSFRIRPMREPEIWFPFSCAWVARTGAFFELRAEFFANQSSTDRVLPISHGIDEVQNASTRFDDPESCVLSHE